MRVLGTPTIQPVLFAIAKTSLVPPHVFLAWAVLGAAQGTLRFPELALFAALAAVSGLAVAVAAIRHLGESVRVGLPSDATALRVGGLYRFSRNPIYAGVFLSMLGSCVLVPHWANLMSTTIAIVLHHRIVLAEERFLDGRFGQAWRDYCGRVRRYC